MSDPQPSLTQAPKLTTVQWLICVIAAIGFAFDIYELLMLPLILRPALEELGGIKPGTPEFTYWFALMFYVPAVAGGIFGLLGGYLTDRLGRRFVLTWSILLYAFSAFAAGFSTSLTMLLILRSTTFVGVCIEFVAAVAWLAELFPNPHQREKVLGYTQGFSSIGGLLVAVANGIAVNYATHFPAISIPGFLQGMLGTIGEGHHQEAWRYTLMSGLIPAIPLIVIRPFLPESPIWQQKQKAGTLKRPSFAALFSPELRRTTIVTTIMFACSYGAAFGAIQQMPQIVPGLKDVKARAAKIEGEPKVRMPKVKQLEQATASDYTKAQEVGGLLGRFALAILAVYIVSRRALIRLFLVPGLFLMPLIFYAFARGDNISFFEFEPHIIGLHGIKVCTLGILIALAGFFTVGQFSFWGNYLPRVYPVHLRGTGESFAANIGGRLIGTSFAALAGILATTKNPAEAPTKMAYVAAGIAFSVYLVALVASFYLPEPLPEDEMEN